MSPIDNDCEVTEAWAEEPGAAGIVPSFSILGKDTKCKRPLRHGQSNSDLFPLDVEEFLIVL